MLAGLHSSTYDGASEDEIRAMFHGAAAGYESNSEKEIRQNLKDVDAGEKLLVEEREQLILNGDITDEKLDAYDRA